MPLFKKKTISEQFSDALLSDIQKGLFTGLLPSVRDLALHYKLNQVSVHTGLRLLVEQGALLSRGPRRRLVIKSPTSVALAQGACSPIATQRLLILSGADHTQVSSVISLGLLDIIQGVRALGGDCEVLELHGQSVEAAKQASLRALSNFRPTHAILICCDPQVGSALLGKGIKLAKMGCASANMRIQNLAPDLALLCTLAFARLQKLRHRKMRFLMLGRPENPATTRFLDDYSVSSGLDVTGVFGGKLEYKTVGSAVAKALKAGVTAFVVARPEDYVLVDAYLESCNLVVPKDISLVLLLGGPFDFMQSRKPAHFRFGKEQLKELALSWMEFGENRSERVTREMDGSFQVGGSIAAMSVR